MKRFIMFFLCCFSALCFCVTVAEEKEGDGVYPTSGINLYRRVPFAKINGEVYRNLEVELKAAKDVYWPFFLQLFIKGVKVVVKDKETGKIIYRKRFKDARLYVFPSGQIQVGLGNHGVSVVDYVIIWQSESEEDRIMSIDEKGLEL